MCCRARFFLRLKKYHNTPPPETNPTTLVGAKTLIYESLGWAAAPATEFNPALVLEHLNSSGRTKDISLFMCFQFQRERTS